MVRSTRSRSKLQTEIEVKDPTQAAPSIGEELIESRSPLNPLGARAALASLIFKQPLNLEFSIHHEEEKSFSNSADITTNKEVTVEASNGTKSCISSVVNYSIMSDKHSSKIGGSSVPLVSKTSSIVKSLFSRKNEPQLADAYSGVMVKESKNEHTQEVIDNRSGLTCSITERKTCQPTTRLTRSAAQKGIGISDDNIDKKIGVGETKVRLTANRGRLTRSKVHLEEEFQNVETKKVMEQNTPAKYSESDSSEKIVKDQGRYVLKDQSMFASQITVGVDLLPNEEIERTVKKETSKMKYDTKWKTCSAEANNSNNTKRLTRSTVHAVLGNKTTEVTPVLEENEFSEHVNTDLSPGNVTDLVSNVLETKESTSSPLYVDLILPFTEGTHGRNKRRMSGDFKVPEKTEGMVTNSKCLVNISRKYVLVFSIFIHSVLFFVYLDFIFFCCCKIVLKNSERVQIFFYLVSGKEYV